MSAKATVVKLPTTPVPLPTGFPEVPPFDPGMLPDRFRPLVMDIAERMQCPPEFPATGIVVAAGSVIGRQVGIRPKEKDDWTVIPNSWGGIVALPGMHKSPAINEVLRPITLLERLAKDRHGQKLAEFNACEAIRAAVKKNVEKQIRDLVQANDMEGARLLTAEQHSAEEVPPPRRRYKTNDSTIEQIGELLKVNPRGLLVFRDELTGWFESLERIGQEGARAAFLEAWSGDGSFTFDRIGRGTVDIEAMCLSVFGGIQPGPLAKHLAHLRRGAGDDGLIQRFQMIVWPDVNGEWHNIDRAPDEKSREIVWDTFKRLDEIDPAMIGAQLEEGSIPYLRFDGPARDMFTEWRETLEVRIRIGNEAQEFISHLAKYRSLVPKLALIFHLVDGERGPVSVASTQRALDWVSLLEAHARRLYYSGSTVALGAANAILERLKRGHIGSEFTARDVYRPGWSSLADRRDAELGIQLLVEHDWLMANKVHTGGRPTMVYRVNPYAAF